MPEIPSIGHGSVGPINRASNTQSYQGADKTHTLNGHHTGDRVELSAHARLLNEIKSLPEVRDDLVDRIRREIAEGTYETPEKLDQAFERLLHDV